MAKSRGFVLVEGGRLGKVFLRETDITLYEMYIKS